MGFGDLSLARKRAIVDFLFRRPNVSLGEAATHFGLSWEALRDEVSQLSTVELVSGSFFESPFDVWIDDDVPTPDSLIRVSHVETEGMPALSPAEIVSLLGAIDTAFVAADSDDAQALSELRGRIVEATEAKGYGSVLWPAPQMEALPAVLDAVNEALASAQYLTIEYWKFDLATNRMAPTLVEVAPVSIIPGRHPLLLASYNNEVRRYRIDRITDATVGNRAVSGRLERRISGAAGRDTIDGVKVRLWCQPGCRWVVEDIPGSTLTQRDNYDIIELPVRHRSWLMSLVVRLGQKVERVERV
ncbi:Uncharacterised protein [Arcanobacterium haemolyticum]|uniref:helix-turn-helix transcriptional regulator n=1 Tax=Arcanobacterium haemolyticum TaxID=28264 RepID=UPI000D8BBA10|nr:WYL domain-containing protein [Arcanobacterium haemolyticum]SPT74431.1 Uncharacterised protein [Arcanobacterium haemolyticum]